MGIGILNFFHLSTLVQSRKNRIEALQEEDGSWVVDQVILKDMAYMSLYRDDPLAVGEFLTGCFPSLSREMQHLLKREYRTEEVESVLKSMAGLKASSSDGLQAPGSVLSEGLELGWGICKRCGA